MKRCSMCKKQKAESAFGTNTSSGDRKETRCRKCKSARNKVGYYEPCHKAITDFLVPRWRMDT